MDYKEEGKPRNLQCSSKTVSKTDICTNCYSRICQTCQIREDFIYCERAAVSQRSELYVDEIYTCNICDQTWMDLFSFCFNCCRVMCTAFQDKHDECPKVFSLMKSDIVKRRRLTETANEINKFSEAFEKKRIEFNETCHKWKKSQLLSTLKSSKSSIIAKLEETERFFINDADIFLQQLSGVDHLLDQHGATLESVKSQFDHIRRKQVFPIKFLQEVTDLEYKFRKLAQTHEQVDIVSLKDAQIVNLDCKPKEVEIAEIKTLLGIEGIKRQDVSCSTACNDRVPNAQGNAKSCTSTEENGQRTETKEPYRSQTLPSKRSGSESSYYRISVLEKELKSKDEEISQLTGDLKSLKNQTYLINRSRKAAKAKLETADTQIKEIISRHENEMQNVHEAYQSKIDGLQEVINQMRDEAKQVEGITEIKMKAQEDEMKDLHSRFEESMRSLSYENESLREKNKELEKALQQAETDARVVRQNTEENTERYNSHLKKNVELIHIQNLQIEELQNLVRCLEKEKESGNLENTRFMKTENQKIKEKLNRVKRMFDHWSASSSSLNSMMAQELHNEDIALGDTTSSVQQHSVDIHSSPDSELCTSQKRIDSECSQSVETRTTVVSDVTTEGECSKHITSITYNAKQIHLIQNSQVSLADSGFEFDNSSLFGEKEDVATGEENS